MSDPVAAPAQPRTTVLITDDEAQVCVVGARMIAHLGFAVLTATDGPTAIALVQAHDAELGCVVLDINMPHMDGITAAVLIRQLAPQLPIVLMSAGVAPPRTQAAAIQIAGFLQKPFTLHDLQALLTPIIRTAAS
jgi:CheY-like chemotaxis protein